MRIFILESLRKNDPKTGNYIHEFLDNKGVENEYYIFRSKQELLDLLNVIQIKASSENFQPFVHFDCHGNEDGIGVVKQDFSEELISWKDIRLAFRDIYTSSKNKSVICMSSCNGFNVVKLVAHNEPCPYDHVCGSFESISFADAYFGYTKFYELVLSGKSIFDAAVEINNTEEFKTLKFLGINSYTLFKIAIDGYMAIECTEEKLKQKKIFYTSILQKSGPLTPVQIDYLDKAFSLEGQRLILENHAKVFFE